jgi:hypothetical protein
LLLSAFAAPLRVNNHRLTTLAYALLTDGSDPLEATSVDHYSDYSRALLKCVLSALNAKNPARLVSEPGRDVV